MKRKKNLCLVVILLAWIIGSCTDINIYNQLPDSNSPGGINTDEVWQGVYQDNILAVPKIIIESCFVLSNRCWESGHASGFIVAENVVATNYHVAEYYNIINYSDSDFPFEVVYYKLKLRYPAFNSLSDNDFLIPDIEVEGVYVMPEYDLALLKVNTLGRSPVKLSENEYSYDKLEILDKVMAMGYPLSFDFVATVGKITALGTNENWGVPWIDEDTKLIKVDAQMDAGNSGGPLFNNSGEVIGINFAVALGYATHGLAISIDYFKRISIPKIIFQPSPIPPNPKDYNETVILNTTGEIYPDEMESYVLNLEEGCIYRFEARSLSEGIDGYYRVYDPNGNMLGIGTTWMDMIFLASLSGEYQLDIYSYSSSEVLQYSLKVRQFCK